jgi:hypothetical protein
MAKRMFWATALLIAFTTHPAMASDEVRESAVTAALRLSRGVPMLPIERRELVDRLLEYWQHFDGRIPRNSPAEAEWLKGELSTRIAIASREP